MGTLSQKLAYTISAVNDIQKALEEKGFDMMNVELARYGDYIRNIKGSSTSGSTGSNNPSPYIDKMDNVIFIPNDSIKLAKIKRTAYKVLSRDSIKVAKAIGDVTNSFNKTNKMDNVIIMLNDIKYSHINNKGYIINQTIIKTNNITKIEMED